ncbi:hypothetical protein MUA01_06275 [Enterobacteriaceae bacterium H18W14]|uniref:hypothetical protein n=1 Tax=Dryocola boscaweniae TaxID=2925397 RepID=UPI0022F072A7|nr:hypothetical protein [Dryocola boscaweniae]MCT4714589.1 hypothetical protein [Dryocola boscaweniae]
MINAQEFDALNADQQAKLSNLLGYITNDDPKIKQAKHLLVAGNTPLKVSKILELPLGKVQKLHSEGWNPRNRQAQKPKQAEVSAMLEHAFREGADLKTLCERFGQPLLTVVRLLERRGWKAHELAERMPENDDPLVVTYRKTIKRHANRKQKSPQLH